VNRRYYSGTKGGWVAPAGVAEPQPAAIVVEDDADLAR
jgi:hypothetical protein